MNCIDLMSKLSKMLSYVAKHSKQRKTTKVIKLQWIASIWHQNDLKCWDTSQNYKCDHITMNLHRFDVKTITTTHNYEIDQIIMHCINLTSKRSKKLSYVPKLQKKSNYNELHRFDIRTIIKCWVTSQNIQNNAKLRKSSNYNELHRFDVKTISNQRKTTKWSNLMIDLTSKRSQNYKCDHITMNLHRFDVKTITTTQNYESDQIIMHCINLTSKRSKKLSYVPKLQKKSNYNEFDRFDIRTI